MPDPDKQKFRLKSSNTFSQEEEDLPESQETSENNGSKSKFLFKTKDKDEGDGGGEPKKFLLKQPERAEVGEEKDNKMEFKVKDSSAKKGLFSFRKKEREAPQQREEMEKAAFRIKEPVEKKGRFSFRKKEPKIVQESVPEKEVISFRKKEPKAIPEQAPEKEVISFKKKDDKDTEDITAPGDKVSFKAKRSKIAEEIPAETVSFTKKKAPSFLEENAQETVVPEEPPSLESAEGTPVTEKMRFSSKPAGKKTRKYLKSIKKKVSQTSDGIERSFLGRLFSSPILNGIVLGLVSMVILLLMTVMKDSPSSSIFYRACFLPQIFLIYVMVVAIAYVISIVLILFGVNKRFKDRYS